jgi:hypothetical protein
MQKQYLIVHHKKTYFFKQTSSRVRHETVTCYQCQIVKFQAAPWNFITLGQETSSRPPCLHSTWE